MDGGIRSRISHDANEVIFPYMNILICQVAMVIIWRNDLKGRVSGLDFRSLRRWYFVVDYLVFGTLHWYFFLSNAGRRSKIAFPSVLFFIGSIQVELT